MTEIRVDEVYPEDKVIIMNFRNGYITKYFKTDDCELYEDENTGKKTVVAEIDDMLYVGHEETEDSYKTLILARDKITGKTSLIEAITVNMKPVLKPNLDTVALMDYSDLEFSRKFGSKRHRQMMEHREKMKVNVQTVNEQMLKVTGTITEDQLDISSYNKTDSNNFYIPIINREATKVEDVYDIDNILTKEQFEKIYSELKVSGYESDLNPFLKSILNKNMSKNNIVLLVYANTLLKLYVTSMKDIKKKAFTICPHSVTLNEIVLKEFLTNFNGKRGRSAQLKDKSLCHALVFIFLINNYAFDCFYLCEQVNLTPTTVMSNIALTGATLLTVGNKKIAQLKLPLRKPPLRRKRSKL